MNEKLRGICARAWNEPRHFCLWLTLSSSIGLALAVVCDKTFGSLQNPPQWLRLLACICAVSFAAGIVAGIIGFVLSWVPPVRRLMERLLRRRFFVLACLVTLIAVFYTEENARGKWAWDKFKREWEAKGEQFELSKIAPPPVPDDQNFAMAPIVVSSYGQVLDRTGRPIRPRDTNVIDRLSMPLDVWSRPWGVSPGAGSWQKTVRTDLKAWQTYYCRVAQSTNLFPVASQPQAPAADVLTALGKYDAAIEEVRQAARRPYARFPQEYDADNPDQLLLPYLASLKSCEQALQLRACAEVQLGQTNKALADVVLSLRLAEALHTEPILISHLVRCAIVNLTLQPVWEGLKDHKWTDEQLAALDQALSKLDFLADWQTAMRGEMTCWTGVIDYLRRTRSLAVFQNGDDSSRPDGLIEDMTCLIPSGWFYQNELACARFDLEGYVPLADREHRIVSPAAVDRLTTALNLEVKHLTPYTVMEGWLLPALGTAVKKFAIAQANTDLARTACAIERYRLAQGEYPESLDALQPKFMASLPHDIINGQPLKYHRTAKDGFVLYSVGWNESDDGGVVAVKENGSLDLDKGDWVWSIAN